LTEIERSWDGNAAAWTTLVRSGGIASRRLVTDAVVVDAVLALRPARVLDLGCGEGWLTRALCDRGVSAVGADGCAALIDAARREGGGGFVLAGYDDLAADPTRAGIGFDAVVANFALLHDDAVLGPLLHGLRQALAPRGALIIQTVHPAAAGAPWRDGWRTEDFRGFGTAADWRPMPWYFRTAGSWLALLRAAGYVLDELREPLHPETGVPASLLMTARP
jgi:2-polyprenyl-3-methyl-5-hydroxy-6-metoxy-1,4-benzoquinol methylase